MFLCPFVRISVPRPPRDTGRTVSGPASFAERLSRAAVEERLVFRIRGRATDLDVVAFANANFASFLIPSTWRAHYL